MATFCSRNLLFSEDEDIKKLEKNVEILIKQKKFDFSFVEQVFNIAYYYQHSDPIKGLDYVKNILLIQEIMENEDLLSIIYTKYGNIHAELEKNDLAVRYLMDALIIAKKHNKKGTYYWVSVDLGNVFFKLREYDKAIENYTIAANGFEEMNDIELKVIYHARAVSNENIGLAYANLKNYDSALHYLRISQKYRYLSQNKLGIKLINYNIGKFFYSIKQYDSTYSNLSKSLSMTDFVMELPGINYEYSRYHIKAMFLLSIYFDKLNNRDSSQYYYNKALEWVEKSLTTSPRIVVLAQTSEIYLSEKKYSIALDLAKSAHKLIVDSSYYVYLPVVNKLLSGAYFELGDFSSAMKYRLEYDRFYDSTSIFSQVKSIELEIGSRDLQSKIRDVEKQKEEKDKEVEILYRIAITLIIFIGVITIFVLIFYKLNREKKKLNKQLISKNDELNAINGQLRDSQLIIQNTNEELLTLNTQLSETNFELEESNNTKNKLFSIIAHDMKNAIGGSISLIDLLNKSYDELTSDERKEFVDLIAKSSNRIYKLLENLLTWSSTLRGKVRPNFELHSLFRVVNNSVALFEQITKEKHIKINNIIKSDFEFVFDASLIDTVIRNILNNSIKYSLPKSNIYIDAKFESDCIIISIRDEGIGMSQEKAKGIFSSEFNKSTDGTNGEKGTGLGLMICHEFVKLHNGDIWFNSEINKGTTCFIKLPTRSEEQTHDEE